MKKKFFGIAAFVLLIVSAFTYLPLVSQIGYLNDDWYLMYDAYSQGSQFLHEVWRIDRPGRALLMIPLFDLFGTEALWYHLSAYLFRFLGGLSLFWTLHLLWDKRKFFPLVAAILFTIYPGFLAQTNAIDYQSHIAALFFAMLSVALTVKALQASSQKSSIPFIAGSVLLGWAYLSQMEYFIALEIFRLAVVLLLVLRKKGSSWQHKIKETFFRWLPFAAAPAGFLVWRLFFFETARRATDVGFQVGQVFSSPLVGLWWLVYLVQDIFNVLLVAWAYPLYIIAYGMRLRDTLIGFSLAAIVVFVVWLGLRWGGEDEAEKEATSGFGWMRDEYWLGLVTIIGGLMPVIMVNRHIVFPDLSRYALPASVGAVILLAAIIDQLPSRSLKMTITAFLVTVSVITHHANALRAVNTTEAIRDFWWQVTWRAPDIEIGTTLVANYPTVGISEDYFVWGPANMIYHPEKQDADLIEIKLPAAVLTNEVVLKIRTGKGVEEPERRGNIFTRSFDNLLFMVQTSQGSCVRFIDGNAPELSSRDSHRTMIVAPYSKLDNVLINADFPAPPESIFGSEPQKNWCYYYQKASLARQQNDWGAVIELQEKALKEGFYPTDGIEWMPLLEAYTRNGEKEKMRPYISILRDDPFLAAQACQILSLVPKNEEMQTYIEKKICE
jgi:hypothetical protein